MENFLNEKEGFLYSHIRATFQFFFILIITVITACAPSLDKQRMAMKNTMAAYMNTPYRYGGTSKSGIDCSAFAQRVYASAGIKIPRTVAEQFSVGRKVEDDEYLFGDLLFFDTTIKESSCCCFFFPFSLFFGHRKPSKPTHVGIYTSGGKFVHASTSRGVTTDSINSSYWKRRFLGARRILKER
ncbi:MAG: NlpC/P60 family protein [Candidatus Schekmanbacteria bacterium]|nr:MAG: NlpC/P60 family protein [Candidatus Schekmanbacteria bacterium]